MYRHISLSAMAALALALQACASSPGGPPERGAAAGPLLAPAPGRPADRLTAPVRGTIIGAFVGESLGTTLTDEDVLLAGAAQQRAYAAPVGRPVTWSNPATGHSGAIIVLRDGRNVSGDACRAYRATISVGGQTQQAYGTACQQANGDWRVIPN
jgi:surface antigen